MPLEFQMYRGEKFFLQTTGRYFQSGRKSNPERLLHRRVWADVNGPVPAGHDVHHLDEDWRNNDITNLEARPATDHRREHMLAKMAEPEFRARALQALRDGAPLAAEWHASPEGRAWHAENGRQAWTKREPEPAVCAACGTAYLAHFVGRSGPTFCSSACQQRGAYGKYKTLPGVCAQCGINFMRHRFTKPKCCSRTCAARRRRGHPPTTPSGPDYDMS